MKSPGGELTELEGAVLSEIHHRNATTAFKVRRAFQVSPSLEWSGSAGAVYPAIRRLTAAGLIEARPTTSGRKTSLLALTAEGVARLADWICDARRAISVGLDPFRLRSGMWDFLDADRRQAALTEALAALNQELAFLADYLSRLDKVERRRVELSIVLQKARIAWIEEELAR
ncbi:PadR family transcriptional regulator [Caulobacter mirabilis]|uniref:Uncharacterized protein n=1 Tax=Caulobacter mirabilis TaxID=69666 RepID=A0A2D2ASX4_9CAUL|nr:PadR family transcriptional regulator [Caulobacter mirabilis]ATQ41110.1 hypothetical protein CSW64_01150 [Caulobacter mirabilis]